MKLDLHIHTTASDGAWSPEAVVRGAAKGGLDVIAVADHDTTAAFATASAVGAEVCVQVIPALEVSSTHHGRDVHVLAYFVDLESMAMTTHSARAIGRRDERMREMVDRLTASGIDVTFEQVEAEAGPDRVAIGRPHLARALVAAGYATSVHEAFNTLIGDHSDAFVSTCLFTPVDAVELILEADGVPIWAHPPGDLVEPLLPELVRAGLRGLEVYRPSHKRHDMLRYERICRTSGLLMSGGSDWHTPDAGSALGDFFVEAAEVEKLLVEGGM
jgi:predicted metal-dependent phosphoesterase TrpH